MRADSARTRTIMPNFYPPPEGRFGIQFPSGPTPIRQVNGQSFGWLNLFRGSKCNSLKLTELCTPWHVNKPFFCKRSIYHPAPPHLTSKSYIMTPVSLQLHDLTPESGHELTPHLLSNPPSPEMGYESLVNESRSGDSISRIATMVCSSISITVRNGWYLPRIPFKDCCLGASITVIGSSKPSPAYNIITRYFWQLLGLLFWQIIPSPLDGSLSIRLFKP